MEPTPCSNHVQKLPTFEEAKLGGPVWPRYNAAIMNIIPLAESIFGTHKSIFGTRPKNWAWVHLAAHLVEGATTNEQIGHGSKGDKANSGRAFKQLLK